MTCWTAKNSNQGTHISAPEAPSMTFFFGTAWTAPTVPYWNTPSKSGFAEDIEIQEKDKLHKARTKRPLQRMVPDWISQCYESRTAQDVDVESPLKINLRVFRSWILSIFKIQSIINMNIINIINEYLRVCISLCCMKHRATSPFLHVTFESPSFCDQLGPLFSA